MARFKATIQSDRSETSRLGRHGIITRCNGWGAGVEVQALRHGKNDEFEIYLTGGSGGGTRTYLGTLVASEGQTMWLVGQKGLDKDYSNG